MYFLHGLSKLLSSSLLFLLRCYSLTFYSTRYNIFLLSARLRVKDFFLFILENYIFEPPNILIFKLHSKIYLSIYLVLFISNFLREANIFFLLTWIYRNKHQIRIVHICMVSMIEWKEIRGPITHFARRPRLTQICPDWNSCINNCMYLPNPSATYRMWHKINF